MKWSIFSTLLFSLPAFSSFSLAQTPFWTEDFSNNNGLPSAWTTQDASGGDALWNWCNDPSPTNACIPGWQNYSDQHDEHFFSNTGDNGYVFADSDALGPLDLNHIFQMTSSPIDCSEQSSVWIKFESLIGVFNTPTLNNAVLRVSNNGVNWTTYNLFDIATEGTPQEPGSVRWSFNPHYSIQDISAIAANQSEVYIQWSWEGAFEFYWLLDDVALYTEDPSELFIPAHDMRVNSNFFAIAPNILTPASQVDRFGFLADIENIGVQDQTNVRLNMSIIDVASSTEVYTEQLFYGTIASDSLAANQLFEEDGFLPSDEANKVYTATYSVIADSFDQVPNNNTQIFDFIISDTIFAKEQGGNILVAPDNNNWGIGEPHAWAYGNCFYTPNGDSYYARYAMFSIGNAPQVADRLLEINLYEWDDVNENGEAESGERTIIGKNTYEISGDESDSEIITLPLLEANTNEPGPIPLADDAYYLLMLEYKPSDQVNLFLVGSNQFNYEAQVYRAGEVDEPRYAAFLAVDGNIDTEPFNSIGFGRDIVPVVRLSIDRNPLEKPNAVKELPVAYSIRVTPNPADDFIYIQFDFESSIDQASIQIVNANGQHVYYQILESIDQHQMQITTQNLPSGSYYFSFTSQQGSRTIPITVMH